jgi:hypothetical protein
LQEEGTKGTHNIHLVLEEDLATTRQDQGLHEGRFRCDGGILMLLSMEAGLSSVGLTAFLQALAE